MRYRVIIYILLFFHYTYAENVFYDKNNTRYLRKYSGTELLFSTNVDSYVNNRNMVVGVTKQLIVKFINTNNLQNYLKEFHLIIKKKLSKNLYLLVSDDKSKTIEISRQLNKKEDIQYAQPDFVKKIKKR